MIKVNCRDGRTLSFELLEEEDAKQWNDLMETREFVQGVTGISILYNTYWHTLPLPKKFRHINFHAELLKSVKEGAEKVIGERIICQADDVQISLITYYGNRPKMTRIDVRKTGRQRFVPKEK